MHHPLESMCLLNSSCPHHLCDGCSEYKDTFHCYSDFHMESGISVPVKSPLYQYVHVRGLDHVNIFRSPSPVNPMGCAVETQLDVNDSYALHFSKGRFAWMQADTLDLAPSWRAQSLPKDAPATEASTQLCRRGGTPLSAVLLRTKSSSQGKFQELSIRKGRSGINTLPLLCDGRLLS